MSTLVRFTRWHRLRTLRVMAGVALCVALDSTRVGAQQMLPDFQDSIVFSGLNQPTAIEFAADGRVFVAEKSGLIRIYSSLSDPTPATFADLRPRVHNFWDRGMLGFALHPNFPADPYVYVLYTMDAPIGGTPPVFFDDCGDPTGVGCTVGARLSRLTASGDVMSGVEFVMIENWCQQFPSHSIGALEFGPDGALYLTSGDGASFNYVDYGQGGNPCADPTLEGGAVRSQDLRSTADPLGYDGTLLRLDPITGAAMPDNPLVGGTSSIDDRIIAYGLRNPYRFTVHPLTGEVWIGDVGWGSYEEINRVVDPVDAVIENFGWPCYEGPFTQGGYDGANLPLCETLYGMPGAATAPFFAYAHGTPVAPGPCGAGSSAIAGLEIYNGGSYPASYDGALFFCDYARQCIWVMYEGVSGLPDPTSRVTFVGAAGAVVDLQCGPGGDLFYARIDSGTVHRVQHFSQNEPPIAVLEVSPTSGPAPLLVNFDATLSYDPDLSGALTFAWDLDGDTQFDDGVGATITHTYGVSGSYLARVRVTDPESGEGFASALITVDNSPPLVTILAPSAAVTWRVGENIPFNGFAVDLEDGPLPASALSWRVILHHCHHDDPLDCHEHTVIDYPGVTSGSQAGPDHEYPSYLEFRLTATDSGLGDWWNPAWAYRRRISIDATTVGENLSNFVCLVRIDAAQIDTSAFAPSGADLRFVAADGSSLPYEIDNWAPSGVSTVWVKVPFIEAGSGSVFCWMYYGNPAAPAAQQAALVWSDYVGVWHCSNFNDSSPHANHGTNSGTTSTTGVIGGARQFDGLDDFIACGSGASLAVNGALTQEAWIRNDNPGDPEYARIISKKSAWDAGAGYELEYNADLNLLTGLGSGSDYGRAEGADLDTAWHHVAVTFAGSVARLYIDGVDVTNDGTVSPLVAGGEALTIGRHSGGGAHFDGAIDEVRLAPVARSGEWIAAELLSMTGALVTIGPQQSPSPLSTTASVIIQPEVVTLTFATSPTGLDVTVYGDAEAAPFDREVIIGATVSIAAPSPQLVGGESYTFSMWSDGGAISHEVIASETPTTYTAFFNGASAGPFIRGDANLDGLINIADAIAMLNYLFAGGAANCLDAVDANDDGAVNVADAIFLLSYQFESGATPPPPFGAVPAGCGADPTADAGGIDLGCFGASAGCP
ncbi:MAG: DUF2341 domain-containing protein [Planctomycetota bacterium]